MAEFRCTCVPDGEMSPHSRPEQCRANQLATGAYMSRREESLPSVRDPETGRFVRAASEAEAALGDLAPVGGGVLCLHSAYTYSWPLRAAR